MQEGYVILDFNNDVRCACFRLRRENTRMLAGRSSRGWICQVGAHSNADRSDDCIDEQIILRMRKTRPEITTSSELAKTRIEAQ